MSLSTCGLEPGIRRLAEENLPITLCLSLHAPNQACAASSCPWPRPFPWRRVMAACRDYVKTGRMIFEYILIDGVNDTLAHADQLAGLVRHDLPCQPDPHQRRTRKGLAPTPPAQVEAFASG